jgi:hypothetical protein
MSERFEEKQVSRTFLVFVRCLTNGCVIIVTNQQVNFDGPDRSS